MPEVICSEEAITIIENIAHSIEQNLEYLTQLDQAIGDGDHGISLMKGFKVVLQKLNEFKGKNIGEILKQVGAILISNVGGAVGPLYGTAFMKAGAAVEDKNGVDLSDLVKMFDAAEKGILDIGKAELGEKTMLDAIHPAVEAIRAAANQNKSLIEAFEASVKAAEQGVKNTIDMISKEVDRVI